MSNKPIKHPDYSHGDDNPLECQHSFKIYISFISVYILRANMKDRRGTEELHSSIWEVTVRKIVILEYSVDTQWKSGWWWKRVMLYFIIPMISPGSFIQCCILLTQQSLACAMDLPLLSPLCTLKFCPMGLWVVLQSRCSSWGEFPILISQKPLPPPKKMFISMTEEEPGSQRWATTAGTCSG